jgi:hypothetical protein
MGQRLNLEIRDGDKILANSYYHWSAYTDSAYELTTRVLSFIEANPMDDHLLLAVRALESTGAGLSKCGPIEKSEYGQMRSRYKDLDFSDVVDRNLGLISVTEEGIKETQFWAEGTSVIDISTGKISFDVFYIWNDLDKMYYEHDYTEEDKAKFIARFSSEEYNYDIGDLTFKDLTKIYVMVRNGTVVRLSKGIYLEELA